MKLLTTLSVVAIAQLSYSQLTPAHEHYLEEKIRNPRVLEYVKEHSLAYKLAKDSGETYIPQGKTPAAFMESIGCQSAARGIDHEFSGGGAEPYIAINPLDPDHIAVTYMNRADTDYPIYVSLDGGSNWTASTFSPLAQLDIYAPGTFILGNGDPVLAFDNYGTLHLTYIYAHGSGFPILGGMYYVYSSDGGFNFTVPADADHVIYEGDIFAGDLLDRQWMSCDNTGGVDEGALYMSAVYFGGGFGTAGELVLKKGLTDLGFTSSTVAVPFIGAGSAQFGNVKVDDNGGVHMACMRLDGAPGDGSIVYVKSTDGGTTFSSPMIVAPAKTGLPNEAASHVVHNRDNTATSLAVDGSNVYIAWSDFTGGGLKGYFAYSSDGGLTFSAPSEFGEELFGAGFYHVMPHVAADNGRVSLSWYKTDTITMSTDYIIAESDNAGFSFLTNAVVSSSPTDFANEDDADFYGDYNSSVKSDCRTFSVFSDGRGGTPIVYFVNEDGCNLGVKDISAINGVLSFGDPFPNPVTQEITISLTYDKSSVATVELVGVDGTVVLKNLIELASIEKSYSFDVSAIASGIYSIRVTTEDEFAIRSFIKK